MTLNVTVLTPRNIYQSADFRLTNFVTGSLITDRSPKTVTLTFSAWLGFVTYTGVGRWRGRDVSELIAVWLTGSPPELSMAQGSQIIANKGNELLRDVERSDRRRRHTFTLAGFEGGKAHVSVISNFEDCHGNSRSSPDGQLTVTRRSLGRGKKATVIITGCKSAVSLDDRRVLGSVAAHFPGDGLRIRRRMEALNADAAPRSQGLVSPDCVVLSFSVDGTGATQLNRDAIELPSRFPHIMNGTNTDQMTADAFKAIGIDPSQLRMVQGAFASTRGTQQATSPAIPCRYAINVPDSSARYQLSEIAAPDFEPMSGRDISDRGQIVGTGQSGPRQQPNIPWSWQEGRIGRLSYTGLAMAVSEAGRVVAILQEPGQQRAAVYQDGRLIELPLYHGRPGVFAGTDSAASAINNAGTIAGNVRSQAEERGHPNLRAAVFRVVQPTIILGGPPPQYACQAVDINERGQVLVVANPAPFVARSILWNPADGTWTYVGDDTTNVFPIALNDEGVVLGQGRNAYTHPVAVICRPGSGWERLGTDDGWIPVDINNQSEVVGRGMIDRLDLPWLRRPNGQTILLPYLTDHNNTPAAINNLGQITGGATADHGSHALLWDVES